MPAHDIPYFEPAGGQNAEASSVVKAFGLARSRKTARRWHAATGRGTADGSSRAAGGAGQVPRCRVLRRPARVRRWWQVARLLAPGPPDDTCAVTAKAGPGPLSCRHGLAGVARWAASSPVRAAVSPHRHL